MSGSTKDFINIFIKRCFHLSVYSIHLQYYLQQGARSPWRHSNASGYLPGEVLKHRPSVAFHVNIYAHLMSCKRNHTQCVCVDDWHVVYIYIYIYMSYGYFFPHSIHAPCLLNRFLTAALQPIGGAVTGLQHLKMLRISYFMFVVEVGMLHR